MKSNLAHEPLDPQGEVVQFPKKERQAMSETKFNYVVGIRSIKMHATTKAVGMILATYADYETGICYPTIQTLMNDSGLSNRVVSHHIKELENLGLVIVKRATGRNSKYKFVAENIEKAVTESQQLLKVSSDFNDIEAVTLKTQSGDAESQKLLLTTINNQENIHTLENPPQKLEDESWKPNLDLLTSILKITKHSQRVSEILGMVDFEFHLGNFNAHWENKMELTENQKTRKFAAWLVQEFEKAEQRAAKTKKASTYQQKPKSALQATADQWAQERFEMQQASKIIDVNQDQVFIGGQHEHF